MTLAQAVKDIWIVSQDDRTPVEVLESIEAKHTLAIDAYTWTAARRIVDVPVPDTAYQIATVPRSKVPHKDRTYFKARQHSLDAGYGFMPFIAGLLFIEMADIEQLVEAELLFCHRPVRLPRVNRPQDNRPFCLAVCRKPSGLQVTVIRHQERPLRYGTQFAFLAP